MCITDSTSELPESLTTHYPQAGRSSCRLLSLDGPTGVPTHDTLADLLDKLNPGDPLVFNDICVTPACLFGHKASGSKIEMLVERMLDDKRTLAHICASRMPKPGAELLLGDGESIKVTMVARHDTLFEVKFNDERSVLDTLNAIDHMPSPSYIDRPDKNADRELCQAVYGEKPGAVVAPTTRLHFDDPPLAGLRDKDTEMASVTLHAGVGTFQPVCVGTIEDHIMHSEYMEVPQDVVDAVLTVKTRGNRMITVGITSVRSLESAAWTAKNGLIEPFFGDIQIFIYPGCRYQVIDALVTNFHLPEPTLTMLVFAFVGYKSAIHAHHEAVKAEYRFFSYGDAMLITYNP